MHTFTSIYLHVVFATWSRQRFITDPIRPELHAYIAGTARNLNMYDVHAGGHEDHVHLLGRVDPAVAPSELIGKIKKSSTTWMHEQGFRLFRWQRGFSAFSVSRDRVPNVIRYIQNQEEHHRRLTFRDELEKFLTEHGISFEEAHLL